jgi:hypothetical protein
MVDSGVILGDGKPTESIQNTGKPQLRIAQTMTVRDAINVGCVDRRLCCSSVGRVPRTIAWSTSYSNCGTVKLELELGQFGNRKIAATSTTCRTLCIIWARARCVAVVGRDSDGQGERRRLVCDALKDMVCLLSHELCSATERVGWIGVVGQAVVPDEIQISSKVVLVLVSVRLDLARHGPEVHRVLDVYELSR